MIIWELECGRIRYLSGGDPVTGWRIGRWAVRDPEIADAVWRDKFSGREMNSTLDAITMIDCLENGSVAGGPFVEHSAAMLVADWWSIALDGIPFREVPGHSVVAWASHVALCALDDVEPTPYREWKPTIVMPSPEEIGRYTC